MSIKKCMSSLLLAALTIVSFQAGAENINVTTAKAVAHNYINRHMAGKFNSPNASSLRLAHAEASNKVTGANDYYAFNLDGGGFIIVAGEDRATPVLGYSDKGQIDFNNLPASMQDLLNSYKREIEYLQTYEGDDLVPAPASFQANGTVGPLIKTTWGQEMPYYLQCPKQNGEYCVVGCVATAMAQVMYYWKYPEGSNAIASYSPWFSSMTVPGLPATTFNYRKMLLSYCHWDWENSELIQDTYTDEQAQEVAKLGRYCGQAAEMDYSPEGSGAYTDDQLAAMKSFGYTNAKLYQKSSGWGSWGGSNYTTAQWEAMIKTEIDAGRPILYSASDTNGAGGHAFICDGYNSDNKFHFNMGWYGTCDGWYASTALNMTHRDGDYLQFNSGHEMITNLTPPAGWEPPTTIGDVNMDGEVNISDVIALINYLTTSNATGIDLDAANINGDSAVNITDAILLINQISGN